MCSFLSIRKASLKTFSKDPKSENVKILERLSAKDKAYFVGLIEGDGWFTAGKNGAYVKYEKGIKIPKTDLPLLEKFNEIFNNKGSIIISKVSEDHIFMSTLKFSNKQFFRDVIIPIFDEFPKITDKFWKYQYFRHH